MFPHAGDGGPSAFSARTSGRLPKAHSWPLLRGPNEFDPGCLERPLKVDEGLGSAGRDSRMLFQSFYCQPGDSGTTPSFSCRPVQHCSCGPNLSACDHNLALFNNHVAYLLIQYAWSIMRPNREGLIVNGLRQPAYDRAAIKSSLLLHRWI